MGGLLPPIYPANHLHSEACNALGASDGVIHSSISHEVVSLRATTNNVHQMDVCIACLPLLHYLHMHACLSFISPTHYQANCGTLRATCTDDFQHFRIPFGDHPLKLERYRED